MKGISRRDFLRYSGVVGGGLLVNMDREIAWANTGSLVTMVQAEDRRHGVRASLSTLGMNPVKGKDVLIKPNFNTADPTPGSTHNDTLTALAEGTAARRDEAADRRAPKPVSRFVIAARRAALV